MEPNVVIVILNWNGWKDTVECLESLYQISYPNYDVIVLDNASSDESLEKIREYCEGKLKVKSEFFEYNCSNKPIKILKLNKEESQANKTVPSEFFDLPSNKKLVLIKNDANYGFAEGNNIGIRYANNNLKSDYILLLNNDTVVDKQFLYELTKIANIDKKIGVLGPTINFYNNKNKIQSAGAKINWNKGTSSLLNHPNKLESRHITQVDYVSGCALLAKTELFRKIGLLNSKYFAYWEETDFCINVTKKGYKVINVPKSKIWHKVSSSTGQKGIYKYYMIRNMFWFMKQHSNPNQRSLFLLYFFFYKVWSDIFVTIFYYKDINSFIYLLKGTSDGLFKTN